MRSRSQKPNAVREIYRTLERLEHEDQDAAREADEEKFAKDREEELERARRELHAVERIAEAFDRIADVLQSIRCNGIPGR